MPHLTLDQWSLAILCAVCIGLSKGGFGGVGMVAILMMTHVFPPRESTGAILPMLIMGDIFAVVLYRKYANGRLVLRLMPPAVAGIICGWLLIPHIPAASFGAFLGWLTVALIILVIIQKVRPEFISLAAERPQIAWPLGWLAGITTMIGNAAGPVMTSYLLACRLPKMQFVGTAAWFFFAVNVIKVPFSMSLGLINIPSLSLNLCLFPAVVLGFFMGRWLLGKINQAAFDWSMIVLTLLGALRLIIASLAH